MAGCAMRSRSTGTSLHSHTHQRQADADDTDKGIERVERQLHCLPASDLGFSTLSPVARIAIGGTPALPQAGLAVSSPPRTRVRRTRARRLLKTTHRRSRFAHGPYDLHV
ncbi:MAG: hypothetical protein CTY20_14265 [Hyphomicrobium sp.]|nr:MAG: hypothetical protein CTY20_14265 [Hyphomicrobium sp.]